MIPVDQTTFGDGSDGSEPGNCFAACVASLLEMPVEAVPNFMDFRLFPGDGQWYKQAQRWLAGLGLAAVDLYYEGGAPSELWEVPLVQRALEAAG